MEALYLAGFDSAIEPAVDGGESDAEFLGKVLLGDLVFEAVMFKAVYHVHSI